MTDLLNTLASEDEAPMLVTVPLENGDTTTWRWIFATPSHPKGIAQKNRVQRENLKKTAAQEQAMINRKKYKSEVGTPEQVDSDNVDFIIERLLGWSSKFDNGEDVMMGGEPLPYSEENARKLLMTPSMWKLRNDAIDFIITDENFTRRSGKK